ncbi:hypothetical protein TIFTF001_053020 [Ficus carica]|uniref:Uncharacterized protein n=1 Tax=Ficus carica TaxID=3494 RepID=A0AA88EF38_FICCA|nr:hypothetical protein TIFTF001_053020 [Ficus carica]
MDSAVAGGVEGGSDSAVAGDQQGGHNFGSVDGARLRSSTVAIFAGPTSKSLPRLRSPPTGVISSRRLDPLPLEPDHVICCSGEETTTASGSLSARRSDGHSEEKTRREEKIGGVEGDRSDDNRRENGRRRSEVSREGGKRERVG